MPTYRVTNVRMQTSFDETHEHIEGVCTTSGAHYTRQEVVDSLRAGNTWITSAHGQEAVIQETRHCPRTGCGATPYIRTAPTSPTRDSLEDLPRC
jgi:hypothetical protein